jgi:hypothetical protein
MASKTALWFDENTQLNSQSTMPKFMGGLGGSCLFRVADADADPY